MLVLSRKTGEKIIININGKKVTITVTKIHPGHPGSSGQVRLGIEAPKEVPIYRQEIHDAKKNI